MKIKAEETILGVSFARATFPKRTRGMAAWWKWGAVVIGQRGALQGSSFSTQRCLWAVRVGRANY